LFVISSQLWPSIKAFKVKVVSLLHDVGKLLIEYGAICESASAKDVFVKHCEPITGEDSEVGDIVFLTKLVGRLLLCSFLTVSISVTIRLARELRE
jgi:hypothetical protein